MPRTSYVTIPAWFLSFYCGKRTVTVTPGQGKSTRLGKWPSDTESHFLPEAAEHVPVLISPLGSICPRSELCWAGNP